MAGVLIWIVKRNWTEAREIVVQPPSVLAGAMVLVVAGEFSAARAWAAIVGGGLRFPRQAANAFMAAQPTKYLPGGAAFQAVTQVGLSAGPERRATAVGGSYIAFLIVQLAAGLTIGSALVLSGGGVPWALRGLVALGLLSVLLLRRGWMARSVLLASRVFRKPAPNDLVPTQRALYRAFLWALVPAVLSGAAFGLILEGSIGQALHAIPAYAVAWAVGFVVVPLPSGIGLREAVLSVFLIGTSSGAVVAASIVHRLVVLVGELLLFAIVWWPTFLAGLRRKE
jgi:glycosyltransferase 2 family protein